MTTAGKRIDRPGRHDGPDPKTKVVWLTRGDRSVQTLRRWALLRNYFEAWRVPVAGRRRILQRKLNVTRFRAALLLGRLRSCGRELLLHWRDCALTGAGSRTASGLVSPAAAMALVAPPPGLEAFSLFYRTQAHSSDRFLGPFQ
jgi:hypothetical protein